MRVATLYNACSFDSKQDHYTAFMYQYTPLSREAHAHLGLKKKEGYGFASHLLWAPLFWTELYQAAQEYPVLFVKNTSGIMPIAIFSSDGVKNNLVDDKGAWRGLYIPAAVKAYPFILLKIDATQQVLCIDQHSRLLTADHASLPLWNEKGDLADHVRDLGKALSSLTEKTTAYHNAMEVLEKEGCLTPKSHGVPNIPAGHILTFDAIRDVPFNRWAAFLQGKEMTLITTSELAEGRWPYLSMMARQQSVRPMQEPAMVLQDDDKFMV